MCNIINTIQECVSLQEDYAGYRQSRSNQWIEFSFHPNILLKLEPSGGGLYQTCPLLEALFQYFLFLACRSETSLFASEREALTASEPQVWVGKLSSDNMFLGKPSLRKRIYTKRILLLQPQVFERNEQDFNQVVDGANFLREVHDVFL